MNSFNQRTSFPNLLHYLVYLLITITLCQLAASSGCHEEERMALLKFKSFLDDPSGRLSTWKESVQHRNCCEWRGIRCSRESFHVISIDLRNINYSSSTALRGKLSPYLFNITNLEYLDLAFNDFQRSEITHQFSYLTKLNHLDLSANDLQGPIPESICEISPLQHLDLHYNNLSGTIPSCITNLRNLSVFNVSENSIKGKVSLISLINELNLTSLDLSSNKLTVIIDQHLQPSKFKLKSLQLESCNMEGFIPTSFCNFTYLEKMVLYNNKLTGAIPSCISKLENLVHLDLSKNKLGGPLPLLPLHDNHLDLSQNNLNGEISFEAGERAFSGLVVRLYDNKFSGSIPYSICSQKPGMSYIKTKFINLSNNNLSGIIPSNIGYCTSLQFLSLGNNSLTGNVPNIELNRTNLEYLELNDNNINGPFPSFILKHLHLKVLNLENNNFEGNIPFGLGSLSDLRILFLKSNRFNGSIPEDITQLQRLQILDLSSNNLSGQVPVKLGNLTRLTSQLSATMDTSSVQYQLDTTSQFKQMWVSSSRIDLSSNILDGNIPVEICLLKGLGMLNLSHNLFTSSIPESIGDMSSLESLDLSSNRLSGRIPQSLTSIDSLRVLSLSHNNLSGEIPRGNHFDTLSVDGSAFVGNELLCGYPLEKYCKGDKNISTASNNGDQVDSKEKILLYVIVAMGFIVVF